MQVKKFFQTYKLFIITGVSVLISASGFIFGVIPLARNVIAMQQTLRQLSGDIAALRQKTSVLATLDEVALRDNLLTLASAVPPDQSPETILSTIDGVSQETGVLLKDFQILNVGSLSTESAKKRTKYEADLGSSVLDVMVTVDGSYQQVLEFLASAGSVRRLFHIVSFNLSSSVTGIAARITLRAFYFPYPSKVGSVLQPIPALSSEQEATIARVAGMRLISAAIVAEEAGVAPTGGKSDPFQR